MEARNGKRSLDESAAEPPETKRLREADTILEILNSDSDVDRDLPVDDLADVIRSLEEEIAAPEEPPVMDLGYLLEASDDELGLPPAAESPPSTSSDGGGVIEIADEEAEVAGFDRIWGYEDEISIAPSESLEFGLLTEFVDSVNFDSCRFDYRDMSYEDLSWPTESLAR